MWAVKKNDALLFYAVHSVPFVLSGERASAILMHNFWWCTNACEKFEMREITSDFTFGMELMWYFFVDLLLLKRIESNAWANVQDLNYGLISNVIFFFCLCRSPNFFPLISIACDDSISRLSMGTPNSLIPNKNHLYFHLSASFSTSLAYSPLVSNRYFFFEHFLAVLMKNKPKQTSQMGWF